MAFVSMHGVRQRPVLHAHVQRRICPT
jgi:hypothetical protein